MISDIVFITVIGQVLIALGIMVVTFAGRWFAFPRGVILISFILGTILLSVYRIVVYKLYLRVSRDKKVLIVGLEKDVAPAIQNFQSKKTINIRLKQWQSIIITKIQKLIDDMDIVYLASKIPEDEKSTFIN